MSAIKESADEFLELLRFYFAQKNETTKDNIKINYFKYENSGDFKAACLTNQGKIDTLELGL